MHESVLKWVEGIADSTPHRGGQVLEVGSYDVNGSVRPYFAKARIYHGIDIRQGPGVDLVATAEQYREAAASPCGPFSQRDGKWDVVISTEMLEHAEFWRQDINAMKELLAPRGHIILTCRGPGFPKHDHPGDYNRFTVEHMRKIFADFSTLWLSDDPDAPGILYWGVKNPGAEPVDLAEIEVDPVG